MEIPEGTIIGNCENCGIVVGDAFQNNFPAVCRCNVCGEKVKQVRACKKDLDVADHKVTGKL